MTTDIKINSNDLPKAALAWQSWKIINTLFLWFFLIAGSVFAFNFVTTLLSGPGAPSPQVLEAEKLNYECKRKRGTLNVIDTACRQYVYAVTGIRVF